MGTGVEYLAAEELIGAELGAEILGGAELFGGAEALGGSAVLGDFAGTSLAGDIGGSLGLGGFGGGYGGLGAFEGLGGIGGFGVGLGDYGLGSLASSFGGYADGLGGVGITDATGVQNLSNVMGPTGGLNNPLGYGNALSSPSGIYATQPGQFVNNLQGIQNLQGVGANLITPTQEALTQSSLASAGTDYASIPMTQSQVAATNAFNANVPYTGGADELTYKYNPDNVGKTTGQLGRDATDLERSLVTGSGDVGPGRSTKELLSTYGRQPGTAPGFLDNLKTIGSFDSGVDLDTRLEALSNVGSKAFNTVFLNKNGDLNMPAAFAALSLYPTYAAAKAKAGEIGVPFSESDYQAGKIAPSRQKYAAMAPKSAFGITTAANGGRIKFGTGGMSDNRISQIIQLIRDAESVGDMEKANELRLDLYRETKKADGGRIGFGSGGAISTNVYRPAKKAYNSIYGYDGNTGDPIYVKDLYDDFSSFLEVFRLNYHANGGRIGFESGKLALPKDKEGPANKATRLQMEKAIKEIEKEQAQRRIQEQLMNKNYDEQSMYDFKKTQKELFDMAPDEGYPPLPEPVKPEGVLSIKLTPAQQKANGGMMNYPVRMLRGGMSELDLRAKGGFIPIGVKERADDVPAMLSKNEFVFTADAVRNAGEGSINKGAQKMYKLMKSLENKKVKMRAN